jgi:hypothetical protein
MKMCWLCQDRVNALYNGAPGIGDSTFDGVCVTCAAEKVLDFDGKDISEVGDMTNAQMRALVVANGIVRAV